MFPSSGMPLRKASATNFANTPQETPEGLSDIYGSEFGVYPLEGGCNTSLEYLTLVLHPRELTGHPIILEGFHSQFAIVEKSNKCVELFFFV